MSTEVSIIFAFFAMVSWGFGDFFIQRMTRKVGNLETLAFIGIVGTIGLFPLVLGEINLLFNPSNVVLLLFLGILTFIINLFYCEALKIGKISIIDVILQIELPVTVVFSLVFFKEILSLGQSFMISLIFIGTILIAIRSFNYKNIKLEKGVLIAVFAAVGMGLINFLTGMNSKFISPMMTIWMTWFIFTILSLMVIARREKLSKFKNNLKKFKSLILITGIIDTLAWVFYALALLKNEISITTAITESFPAIAILLGVLVNKEKIRWYQYLGAGVTLVFSFVLAFFI